MVIVYDDFEPNGDVVAGLSRQLSAKDVDVRAVADDFFSPAIAGDFRLMILSANPAYDPDLFLMLGRIASFLGQPECHKRIMDAAASYDAFCGPEKRRSMIQEMSDILREFKPALFLGRYEQVSLQSNRVTGLNWNSDGFGICENLW